MDKTHEVNGDLILDQVCISNKNMIHDLEQKGFGEIENGKLFLKSFETLYLLYTHKLFLKKKQKQIDFDTFMGICQKTNSEILTKFLIFRDLKTRGYIVKDGFGFGSDFRVYERGHFGEKGAKFLIFGFINFSSSFKKLFTPAYGSRLKYSLLPKIDSAFAKAFSAVSSKFGSDHDAFLHKTVK